MLFIIDIMGIIAFSISGVIEARRKGMDLIGIFAIALVTSFGGGTLRDLLINRRPLFWIEHQEYTIIVLGISLITTFFFHFKWLQISEKSIIIPDALGLGLYSATGAAYALNLNVSPFIAIIMGIISATFGGVIRDIFCNEVPVIFKQGQLYATCSLFASTAYVFIRLFNIEHYVAAIASIIIASSLRLLAVKYNIKLPI